MNLDISSSTGDDTTWAIVQSWLETCLQTHDRCNERPWAIFVPTRLIQLKTAAGSVPAFRVVHANKVKAGTRYATLSHCFDANDDGLQLTESTLAQLCTLQPLSLLPLTVRDALAVVARLGLSYLWVDRLCVVQDSPPDQRDETSKSRQVFRNAYISIAASGTTSTFSGLFSKRDPALVSPTVFNFPIDAAGATIPYQSSLEVPCAWRRAFQDDPIFRSARALQERLLAPRVVHFGRKMVFWECHGAGCAEIHPLGVDEAALAGITTRFWGPEGDKEDREDSGEMRRRNKPWKTLLDAPDCRIQHDPVRQVFADWFVILAMHSRCVLTSPGERLLALAGVARDMKSLLQERGCDNTGYLAGMWKAMLPAGLLWNALGSGSRPAAYRAPTWSWAAMDGSVNFHDEMPEKGRHEGLLCELVSATTTPCTADETGEVTAGSVVLRGKVAQGRLLDPRPSVLLPRKEEVLIVNLVDGDDDSISLAEPISNSPSGYNCQWTVSFDTTEDMRDEIFCLPIRAEAFAEIGWEVYGLALSQLEDGCYVRRGMWNILVDTEEEAFGIFRSLPVRELEIV